MIVSIDQFGAILYFLLCDLHDGVSVQFSVANFFINVDGNWVISQAGSLTSIKGLKKKKEKCTDLEPSR